ncbi:MAG: diaminopimelate dehydrogenase, partial [Candidatus Firestonebacteria bacterium]
MFNTVDSFDTHANIPKYFSKLDTISRKARKLSIISTGWDPGLFSLNRLLANCVLPKGTDYTFWGKGVSQGHSDAIRRLEGVLDAKQYTCPVPSAISKVRAGKTPKLSTRQKHFRVCYVAAKAGADLKRIEQEIKTMPNYFSDYDTTVHFISEEKLKKEHKGLPHGGFVIRTGITGGGKKHTVEFNLKLESNPEFTGSVMTAYARAAYRLSRKGETGCRTVFDIPYALLSARTGAELRKELL